MSFEHLKKLAIAPEQTSPYEIPELGPDAVLHLAHAGQVNKAYFNARFSDSIAKATKMAKGRKGKKALDAIVEAETNADASRERDRELYPLHIIKGWDGVLDDQGKLAPFSVESAQKIVDILCSDPSLAEIFDGIRGHASNTANYRDMLDAADLEAVAKN